MYHKSMACHVGKYSSHIDLMNLMGVNVGKKSLKRNWTDFFVSDVLVGGFNPFEKYDRQNGNLPQLGVKIKDI